LGILDLLFPLHLAFAVGKVQALTLPSGGLLAQIWIPKASNVSIAWRLTASWLRKPINVRRYDEGRPIRHLRLGLTTFQGTGTYAHPVKDLAFQLDTITGASTQGKSPKNCENRR
jgi:hypothetical protein